MGLLPRSNEYPQREFPYSLTLNFSWSLRSKRGIKICPLLFSILLLIHTAQFTRLFRSKRIGLLYPCYTPALTLFIVAAFNAALVLFLVTHTMRIFFVFRREAIKAHRECPVEIRWSKCAARVSEKHRTP